MYGAKHQGVFFVEGVVDGFRPIRQINTELNGFFSQNQLRSLADIKTVMATEAIRAGGNVVCNFAYGQQSTFFKSLFGMDNVRWYASGEIGVADARRMEEEFGKK